MAKQLFKQKLRAEAFLSLRLEKANKYAARKMLKYALIARQMVLNEI